MKTKLRMKCPSCGYWNRVSVNKIFLEQPSPIDPNKIKVLIPMYEPLEIKCGKVIAEPKELIRINPCSIPRLSQLLLS
jgi:hypothetical protein